MPHATMGEAQRARRSRRGAAADRSPPIDAAGAGIVRPRRPKCPGSKARRYQKLQAAVSAAGSPSPPLELRAEELQVRLELRVAADALERNRRLLPGAALAGAAALFLLALTAARQVEVWQHSVSLYRHALRVTERNAVMHNNLGIALVDRGSYDEAVRVYQQGLEFRSYFSHVLRYNAGIAHSRAGRYAEALALFDEALRVDSGYPEARFHRARALAALGRLEEARQELERVVELTPEAAEPHVELGLVLGKLGASGAAKRRFARALELQPLHVDARINFAIALLKTGETEAAVRELEHVLRLRPDHSAALRYLETARGQLDAERPLQSQTRGR